MKSSRSVIAKRHNYILQKLSAEHSVIVEDLTAELNVSALTIRRDLDDLAAQGKVERFFGGARILSYETQNSYSRLEPSPLPIDEYEEKKRMIAECAASMVKEGDTVLINSSTTAFYMFHLLSDMNITIITNNANALHTVDDAKYELIFTGGGINTFKHSMVGPIALGALKNIRANKCFIGVSGISESGTLSTAVLQETTVNIAMMNQANNAVVILADSSKIGLQHNFDIGSVNTATHIITDSGVTKEQLEMLHRYSAQVLIADEQGASHTEER